MVDLNNLYIHGRYIFDGILHIYNTASGVEFNACSIFISAKMKTISNQEHSAWMKVIIDDDFDNATSLRLSEKEEDYIIFSSSKKEKHNIKLLKASEAIESYVDIIDIKVEGVFLDKVKYDKTFLVYGDSTVSAYGNLGKLTDTKTLFDTDGLKGYAYLTSKAFNASMNSVNGSGWGIAFSPWTVPYRRPLLDLYDKVAPLSGEPFDMKLINPTLAIISLGTNDSYYLTLGVDEKQEDELKEELKGNFHKLFTLIKKDYPNIPIIMVYGVMRERHNYNLMHEVYLENKDDFNLHEALIEGDGLGVSSHPSSASHKEISIKLIEIIKAII